MSKNILAIFLGILIFPLVAYSTIYLFIKFHIGPIGQFFHGFHNLTTREEALRFILSEKGFSLLEEAAFQFFIIVILGYLATGAFIGFIGHSRIWVICIIALLPITVFLIVAIGLKSALLVVLFTGLLLGVLTGELVSQVKQRYKGYKA